jgi:hypothetical protein
MKMQLRFVLRFNNILIKNDWNLVVPAVKLLGLWVKLLTSQ